MNSSYYTECVELAKQHQMFHHYTDLEALFKIISSSSIQLSDLSDLNDLIEGGRVDAIYKHKTFVTCFEHNMHESIPMWKMYSKKAYGVRLSLPNLNFLLEASRYFYYENNNRVDFPSHNWEVRHAVIVDVKYINDPTQHFGEYEPLGPGFIVEKFPLDIGIVKSNAWEYENETRVRVYVDVTKNLSSVTFPKDRKPPLKGLESFVQYNYPNFSKIYCKLDISILSSMTITFYPNMPSEIRRAIILAVQDKIPGFNNFKSSEFDGMAVI